MAVQDAGGLVQGVLTGDFSLAGIDTFLGRIRIGQRGVVALFDGGGPRFITRSDSRRWPTVADSRSSSCL